MSEADAAQIRVGDRVRFRQAVHWVTAISWHGPYRPYFWLDGLPHTEPPVSYLVCGRLDKEHERGER